MAKKLNLIGKEIGELEVIKRGSGGITSGGNKYGTWICKCSCGNLTEVRTTELNRKDGKAQKSCGCCLLHNHSKSINGKPTPTYYSWQSAKYRTNLKLDHKDYETYKDVSMCDRWSNSFQAFLEDMGERPEGTTLDRYPNKKGNYEPGNCRWATVRKQNNNRTTNIHITFQGRTQTIAEWARERSMKHTTLHRRIYKYGWTVEEALTTPVGVRRKKAVAA